MEIREQVRQRCQDYPEAVNAVMELSRAMWSLAFVRDVRKSGQHDYKEIDEDSLVEKISSERMDIALLFISYLQGKEERLCWKSHEGICFALPLFKPIRLARELLEGLKPDEELRYHVKKNIRKHYQRDLSADTAYLFNRLAEGVDSFKQSKKGARPSRLIGIKDLVKLLIKLQDASDRVTQHIRELFSADLKQLLAEFDRSEPSEQLRGSLVRELHRIIQLEGFYDSECFEQVALSHYVRRRLDSKPQGDEITELNRRLLITVFPNEITSIRKRKIVRTSKQLWNYPAGLYPFLINFLTHDSKFRRNERIAWNVAHAEFDEGTSQGLADAQFEESFQVICRRAVDLFVECCRVVTYVVLDRRVRCVSLETTAIDAEFLLTNLFGLPTGIPGFDELFGGGGLRLTEPVSTASQNRLPGRTLLVKGRFGTAKSMLSLQLAVEVARKGGLSWVVALEQQVEELQYMLESVRGLPNDDSIKIITDVVNAEKFLLGTKTRNQGVLIMVSLPNDPFDSFKEELDKLAKSLQDESIIKHYSLRLVCVDPINSIVVARGGTAEFRAEMLRAMKGIEAGGTNVLLVAEEGSENENAFPFEENIADTVIHLSVHERHDYSQRYLEVRKSRLQREQRGRHPFSILPGAGIKVYLSTAAVSNRIRSRALRGPGEITPFRSKNVDSILGPSGIHVGDVIVLQGRAGSFKTPLGLHFLSGWTKKAEPSVHSLLVAVRHDEMTARHMLERVRRSRVSDPAGKETRGKDSEKESREKVIRICSIPRGNISPSVILQRIENEFLNVELQGALIDRVMIDNVADWELSCPFVRDDITFADTLVDLLRRKGVTSLLICSDLAGEQVSTIQRPIIDNADCLMRFYNFEFKNTRHVMGRVLRTRDMKHRPEAFEIALVGDDLEVKPSSLFRVAEDGGVTSVKTRLLLHSETEVQAEYNDKLLREVKTVLSKDVELESADSMTISGVVALGQSSAVDELQIVQLEEFQLPASPDTQPIALHRFPDSQWDPGWESFLPGMEDKVRSREGFIAVPFYQNISLLAYQTKILEKLFPGKPVETWEDVIHAYDAYDKPDTWKDETEKKDNIEKPELFFDFPRRSDEDYNSLFFEILLSMADLPTKGRPCRLVDWLRSGDLFLKASKVYWRLCRRAYALGLSTEAGTGGEVDKDGKATAKTSKVNSSAVVWRHWYSTLNQMVSGMPEGERGKLTVAPLPKNKTIAGESYLGILSHSAAPDVGLEMIKLLTRGEAELDRVCRGVGLPTRSKFYDLRFESGSEGSSLDYGISPYFSIASKEVNQLVNRPFRRSDFGCYSQFSGILSYHLRKIIQIPDHHDVPVKEELRAGPEAANPDFFEQRVGDIFRSLESRIRFISLQQDCSACPIQCRS